MNNVQDMCSRYVNRLIGLLPRSLFSSVSATEQSTYICYEESLVHLISVVLCLLVVPHLRHINIVVSRLLS